MAFAAPPRCIPATPNDTVTFAYANQTISYCQSPLILQLIPGEEKITPVVLTAPDQGLTVHVPGQPAKRKKISWFTAESVTHNYLLFVPVAGDLKAGADYALADSVASATGIVSTGFNSLIAIDKNSDGVIDARDAEFTQLRLWSDSNLNGIAEPSEVHTLEDLQVESIKIPDVYAKGNGTDHYGNAYDNYSYAQTTDGLHHTICDFRPKLTAP